MGITRLGQFFKKTYPQLLLKKQPKSYQRRTFAIDASNTIYSFLAKTITFSSNRATMPTDSHGNLTGHLIGLLYRAMLCKELGMQTIWVFDGRPPRQKLDELSRRKLIKINAQEKAQEARQAGDIEQVVKQSQRTIHIGKKQTEDAKTLLQLMGLPIVQSPAQAQAQCAWITKNKLAQGVIGQDYDTLVFGGQKLVKNFSRQQIALQVNRNDVLRQLQLTQAQFIDFCILCGCDYTPKIPGLGPVKSLKMIKEHKTLQKVIQSIINNQKLRNKHQIPDNFNYLIARRLFSNPQVKEINQNDMKYTGLKEDQLKLFLLERQFDQKRINNWILKSKAFDSRVPI